MNTTNAPKHTATSRLLSLDALRGFDMFWIISGEEIFKGFANAIKTEHQLLQDPANWQISISPDLSIWEKFWIVCSNQFHHTVWNGFTFYDLIFPLFIFIAGISMDLSYSKQLIAAPDRVALNKRNRYASLIRRTVLLILLGMVVNRALQFTGYENTRFVSVLGRIALACFFAAIIYLNCSLKQQLIWFAGLLIGYWAMMTFIPVPGFGAGMLTPEGNLAAYIDRILLPGRLHRKIYDPEGFLSTMPAVCTALLGIFTGQFIRNDRYSGNKKSYFMAGAGVLLILAALAWNSFFPINKNLWTSSFTLFAGGWSLLLLALFYFIIDVKGFTQWSMPFVYIGMNAILIYIASHGLVDFKSSAAFIFGGLYKHLPLIWQDGFMWIGVALIQIFLLYFLYQKKWFLKL